ncbi:inosine/xanthosine triphosphatase [Gracilibacillus orientalis]|uniref:inosine/xanthosine triphosphatase n=1 Tax=Gracilibacillus orientalis TaxID=334253 RepID=A0A1I4N299_9BACI|nr:DUF84 family protein [Gracilibacillus orientalis]SFM09330.1 inosine/xanthosine triphosphatase [Gracilibacillus orientalis]
MNIVVGSYNKAKVKAVQCMFPNANIMSADVDSGVNAQPKSDPETMQGAINRAKASKQIEDNCYGIGLEGGIMQIDDQVFLCNWGALVTPHDHLYIASGARIPLSVEIAQSLLNGQELGEIMREWTKINDIRQHQGAIGIFTDAHVSREDMFTHVVKLLAGQEKYHLNSK